MAASFLHASSNILRAMRGGQFIMATNLHAHLFLQAEERRALEGYMCLIMCVEIEIWTVVTFCLPSLAASSLTLGILQEGIQAARRGYFQSPFRLHDRIFSYSSERDDCWDDNLAASCIFLWCIFLKKPFHISSTACHDDPKAHLAPKAAFLGCLHHGIFLQFMRSAART